MPRIGHAEYALPRPGARNSAAEFALASAAPARDARIMSLRTAIAFLPWKNAPNVT